MDQVCAYCQNDAGAPLITCSGCGRRYHADCCPRASGFLSAGSACPNCRAFAAYVRDIVARAYLVVGAGAWGAYSAGCSLVDAGRCVPESSRTAECYQQAALATLSAFVAMPLLWYSTALLFKTPPTVRMLLKVLITALVLLPALCFAHVGLWWTLSASGLFAVQNKAVSTIGFLGLMLGTVAGLWVLWFSQPPSNGGERSSSK